MTDKTNVVLIACGSYNPVTNMHLRMFEIARDHLLSTGNYEVIGGIISPVSDKYPKNSLIASKNRIDMLKLSLKSSNWIKLSTWECEHTEWLPTTQVLKHHQLELNKLHGQTSVRLMLLCGADLLESFSVPNLWSTEDILDIVNNYGLVCINRNGSNAEKFIADLMEVLNSLKKNIHLITDEIPNDISSTKIRDAISKGNSVKYLINDDVLDYINENGLYKTNAIACLINAVRDQASVYQVILHY